MCSLHLMGSWGTNKVSKATMQWKHHCQWLGEHKHSRKIMPVDVWMWKLNYLHCMW